MALSRWAGVQICMGKQEPCTMVQRMRRLAEKRSNTLPSFPLSFLQGPDFHCFPTRDNRPFAGQFKCCDSWKLTHSSRADPLCSPFPTGTSIAHIIAAHTAGLCPQLYIPPLQVFIQNPAIAYSQGGEGDVEPDAEYGEQVASNF